MSKSFCAPDEWFAENLVNKVARILSIKVEGFFKIATKVVICFRPGTRQTSIALFALLLLLFRSILFCLVNSDY